MKAIFVATLVALAGCGGPDATEPLPWHGRDLSEAGWQNVTLEGHTILEADYTLGQGQSLSYDWVVPAQWGIQFEIHRHDGQDIRYETQKFGAEGHGTYTAPADGIHSLSWTNQNVADVELWIKVPRWDAAGFAVYDDGHNHN